MCVQRGSRTMNILATNIVTPSFLVSVGCESATAESNLTQGVVSMKLTNESGLAEKDPGNRSLVRSMCRTRYSRTLGDGPLQVAPPTHTPSQTTQVAFQLGLLGLLLSLLCGLSSPKIRCVCFVRDKDVYNPGGGRGFLFLGGYSLRFRTYTHMYRVVCVEYICKTPSHRLVTNYSAYLVCMRPQESRSCFVNCLFVWCTVFEILVCVRGTARQACSGGVVGYHACLTRTGSRVRSSFRVLLNLGSLSRVFARVI